MFSSQPYRMIGGSGTSTLGEENLVRRNYVVWMAAALLAFLAVSAGACTFTFSYESVFAPIGTVGEIGIRVQKTHARCTLSSMDEYLIDGVGIQILGETSWEDLGGNLYEKWVQISLAEEGDGALRISKTCTKEGYQEKVLPITSLAPDEDAAWTMAWNGEYPFDEPTDTNSVLDSAIVNDGTMAVGGLTLALPDGAALPSRLPETVRVFYSDVTGEPIALLLLGEGLFVRFDHLAG